MPKRIEKCNYHKVGKHDGCKTLDKVFVDKESHIRIGRNGFRSLMCPDCYNMITIYSRNNIVFDKNDKFEGLESELKYYGTCSVCGNDGEMIELDANIAPTIQLLNKKGYTTKFCCEGHLEFNPYYGAPEISNAYIYFAHNEQQHVLKYYPLPKSWVNTTFVDVLDNIGFVIRDKFTRDAVTACDEEEFDAMKTWEEWDKGKSMRDIYEWANSLPNLTKGENILM